jgi:hypothetical protein
MTNVDEMYLTLVKARYSFIDEVRWSDMAKNPGVEHEEQMLIFKLRKRSIDERKKSPPREAPVPQNMERKLLKEINIDRNEVGFSLYRIPEEKK